VRAAAPAGDRSPTVAFDQIGGATTAVAVAEAKRPGNRAWAFAVVGPRVVVFDLADPGAPRRAAQTELLPEVAEDLALHEGRLYVPTRAAAAMASGDGAGGSGAAPGDGRARLHVFDVAAPDRPVRLGTAPLEARDVGAVAVARELAFVLTEAGVAVVDVKDPAAPAQVAAVETRDPAAPARPWAPGEIAVFGKHLLVARPEGFFVVDVRDPRRPVEVEAARRPGPAFGVAVVGFHALVARGAGGLELLNVADPERPIQAAALPANLGRDGPAPDAGGPRAVAAAGGVAAVVDGEGRSLTVLDVRDPVRPRPLASPPLAPFASDQVAVALAGGRAFVALGGEGLRVVDLTGPESPPSSYGPASPDDPTAPDDPAEPIVPRLAQIDVGGSHIFAAAGHAGLFVLEAGAGESARTLSVLRPDLPEPGGGVGRVNFRGVITTGGFVYAHTERHGLLAIDARDPRRPALAGPPLPLPPLRYTNQMAVIDGHLYIPCGDGVLRVVDVREPAAPRLVAERRGLDVVTLTAIGHAVYATAVGPYNIGHLHVLDASRPAEPRYVRTLDFNVFFGRLAGNRDRLFLTGGFGELAVLDVTAPLLPLESARLKHFLVGRAGIAGDRLIVAHPGAMQVIDLPTADTPRPLGGTVPLPWGRADWVGTSDVTVAGGRAYVLRHDAGLFSFDLADLDALAAAGTHRRYLPLAMAGGSDAPAGAAGARPPSGLPADPPAEPGSCAEGITAGGHVTFVVDASAAMGRPFIDGGPPIIRETQAAIREFLDRTDPGRVTVGLVRVDRQAQRVASGGDHDALRRGVDAIGGAAGGDARLDLGLVAAARDARMSPHARSLAGEVPAVGRPPIPAGIGGHAAPDRRVWVEVIMAADADPRTWDLARHQAARLRLAGAQVHAGVLGAGGGGGRADQLALLAGGADRVRAIRDREALASRFAALAAATEACLAGE